MEQAAHELEVVARRAHDGRDRQSPRAQLEWCFDDDPISIFAPMIAIEPLDRHFADRAHTPSLRQLRQRRAFTAALEPRGDVSERRQLHPHRSDPPDKPLQVGIRKRVMWLKRRTRNIRSF